MNFNDCINNYRIEVKNIFQMEHKKSTLLELRLIADSILRQLQPCFQENTGKTPKEFRNVITSTLTILKINQFS
jgi:hypothetical protein